MWLENLRDKKNNKINQKKDKNAIKWLKEIFYIQAKIIILKI